MELTQATRDELLQLLTYRPQWLNELQYYGGLTGFSEHEKDWRFEKGELFESYATLAEKLEEIAFDTVESEEFDLNDNEICVCGWYFKKAVRDDRRPFGISPELTRAFFNVPRSARIKGSRLYIPFNGKIGHRLTPAS